ncbi:MAG: hypothetical protein ABIP53_05355 [Candidatus Limnocylindrales bacterium]
MTAGLDRRAPAWRSLVWVGVVGSVLAWALAWYLDRGGPLAVMLFVAMASVALAFRATAGMRIALVGLIVASFAMFLGALYLMLIVVVAPGGASSTALAASVFCMVTATVLLLGAVPGFRHSPAASEGARA